MALVVDASVVVAALVDSGRVGRWAEEVLLSDDLAAPHLMPVEVANVLRRASLSGEVSPDVASLAHADLQALRVELFPYEPVAQRSWELRENLTMYDAWYVATAELLGAKLATLDRRLARAAGPRCDFLLRGRA
jgi:predicted nucleic acid-binding protein